MDTGELGARGTGGAPAATGMDWDVSECGEHNARIYKMNVRDRRDRLKPPAAGLIAVSAAELG